MEIKKGVRGPFQTVYCVRCFNRKATTWAGHVTHGRRMVLAGWCKRCLANPGNRFAWHGHFIVGMGAELITDRPR